MADYTASALVASIRRQGFVSESSSLTNEDLLAWVNDEARTYVTALLKSVHEEFLVNELDYTVPIVTGQATYRIPPRVVGGGLRMVSLVTSASVPALPITRVEPPNAFLYGVSGVPGAYMLRGNLLQLLPAPSSGGTLQLTYLQRMSEVVLVASCAVVQSIAGLAVTLAGTLPATFLSTALFDFVRATPAFETIGLDATATFVGNVATFSAVPTGLAVGDYVCLAGECPTPQVPLELQQLLQQRVIVRVLASSGDPRLAAQQLLLEGSDGNGGMKADALSIIAPRVSGNARPIVNKNAPGMRRAWGPWRGR